MTVESINNALQRNEVASELDQRQSFSAFCTVIVVVVALAISVTVVVVIAATAVA